jgi:hypothetical protein
MSRTVIEHQDICYHRTRLFAIDFLAELFSVDLNELVELLVGTVRVHGGQECTSFVSPP